MRLFLSFFYILLVSLVFNTQAQTIANYTSARSTGISYVSINSTGNAFSSWRNTTSFTQDDNRSNLTDIGFDFWYNGVRYTQFSVSTNGFLDFSASTNDGGASGGAFSYDNSAFSNATAGSRTYPALAVFYDDLMAQGGVSALGNSIKYLLTGTAPNRVLTVEWINMAVFGNTSPSLNFQVKLHEKTGVIEYIYGNMNQGTHNFNYTLGLNSQNASNTAANLKVQQIVNTNTFNNNPQNNLVALPTSNSRITFTPPVTNPLSPSGIVSFSSVTQTSMQLNWTNWCLNEVGYVVYSSTDNVNFEYVGQTAINATSFNATGLLPGTTYYWRLAAVTEGYVSDFLTGNQSTNAAGNKISVSSGSWDQAARWSPPGIPTSADNVTIQNGHNVDIRSNVTCNNLIVGLGTSGTLTIGNNNQSRIIDIRGNLFINSGGNCVVNAASNTSHQLNMSGNIVNNGTINFNPDANSLCDIIFTKSGNQTISGGGSINVFGRMILNMGNSKNNTLDIQTSSISVPSNFLTLNSGTFKLSTSGTSNLNPFNSAAVINQNSAIWMNSASSTMTISGTTTLEGNLTIQNGQFNIGNAANQDLLSNGGNLSVTGGTLNISAKYYSVGINNISRFSISGGQVIVPSISSTNTTIAPFQITGVGSEFNMSGGLLIIPREGGTGAQNLGFVNTGSTSGSVTGGTLQIGSSASPSAQTMIINSIYPIGSLMLNSINANASITTNSLAIISDVAINSGTLTTNSLNLSVGRNWINNSGLFIPGTGTVFFNGNQPQTIFKNTGEIFNHVDFSGSGLKTILSSISTNNFIINNSSSVDVSASNFSITVRGNFSNSGNFIERSGLVFFNGTSSQSIGGASTTSFYDITVNNNSGAVLNANINLRGTLLLNNGIFNVNGRAFTMISNAANTARIGPITGSGDISGNVIVQRFAPGGVTGWALLGTPIASGLTLNDWDDDIPISCTGCPDGSAAGFISIYTYDETKPGLFDDYAGYIPMSTINDPIIQNKGYWVYLGTNLNTTTDITLDVTGPVRKFSNTIPLSYTNHNGPDHDGWNLIHNPYPSPISWTALRNGNTNVENAIYTYNADINAYASYVNGVSSPLGMLGDAIPMGQGFYVHALAPTNLNAQETHKVGGNPVFLKSTSGNTQQVASNIPTLRLNLLGSANRKDETVLYMQSGATNSFDMEYDAVKLVGQDIQAPAIALKQGNDLFQINGVNTISSNFSMPVRATTGYPGTYTISLSNFNSFPSGACITLLDIYNNQITNLKNSNYVFTLSDTTNYPRFVLNITIDPLSITSNVVNPNCSSTDAGYITAKGTNAGPWNYYWKDVNGNSLKTSFNKPTADTLYNLNGGNYVLDINTVGMCDNNQSEYTIDLVEATNALFVCEDTLLLSNGTSVYFDNQSVNAVSYTWDFGDGSAPSNEQFPIHEYLNIGTYTVSLITESNTGCLDTMTQKIEVIDNTTSIINLTDNSNIIIKTLSASEYQLVMNKHGFSEIEFLIYDIYGKQVFNFGKHHDETIVLPINLDNFSNGIYFLNINADNHWSKMIKLTVSK